MAGSGEWEEGAGQRTELHRSPFDGVGGRTLVLAGQKSSIRFWAEGFAGHFGAFLVGKRECSRHVPGQMMSAATNAPVSSNAVTRDVTVANKQGIHARPSACFVKLASTFSCEVYVQKDTETINGKSIMGLLMLAAGPGSRLRIICDGPGAEEALLKLVALVESKFGEP